MAKILTKEDRARMRSLTDTGEWKQEPATALLDHADAVDEKLKELEFIKAALSQLRSLLMSDLRGSESEEEECAKNHESEWLKERGVQKGLEKAIRRLDLLLKSILTEGLPASSEGSLIVGVVDSVSRQDMWGWKLRLFHPGEMYAYATVTAGRLSESEDEAVAYAKEVASKFSVDINRVMKPVCKGSSWMEPERVGP